MDEFIAQLDQVFSPLKELLDKFPNATSLKYLEDDGYIIDVDLAVEIPNITEFIPKLNEVFTPFQEFADKYPKALILNYDEEEGYTIMVDLDLIEPSLGIARAKITS